MDGMTEDVHGPGWWVGSDGNWHSPEEDFDADVPTRTHPARRVAVVLLAVAVVGATTVGAWLGGSSGGGGQTSAGPPLGELEAQIEQAVVGTGPNQFGVTGVSGVLCTPGIAWTPGHTFQCSVYASSERKIGVYDGTVEPSPASGGWRWSGTWNPTLHHPITE
jgi:hypothetical protein